MVEILGIVATLCIVIAFLQSGEFKIRVLDAIGAILFIVYGVLIHSFSTILLNSILVGVQLYKLRKLQKEKSL